MRQPVQDAELFLAQPLVYDQRVFFAGQPRRVQHHPRRLPGALVGRGENDGGLLLGRLPPKPAA